MRLVKLDDRHLGCRCRLRFAFPFAKRKRGYLIAEVSARLFSWFVNRLEAAVATVGAGAEAGGGGCGGDAVAGERTAFAGRLGILLGKWDLREG